MIRYISCLKSLDDVAPADFRRRWQDEAFDALVERVATQMDARRYLKSLTLRVEANVRVNSRFARTDIYDGTIEYWWDDADGLIERFESGEMQALADEILAFQSQFIDLTASTGFFTEA